MAYTTTTDSQGNITGLKLSNPQVGGASALDMDIPIPNLGEIVLIGGQGTSRNEALLGIRQGNSVNILSGVYGLGGSTSGVNNSSIASQLGIDLNSLRMFNGSDIFGTNGETGISQGLIGDYRQGQTGFDAQSQLRSNIQQFIDLYKQTNPTIGTGAADNGRNGTNGDNQTYTVGAAGVAGGGGGGGGAGSGGAAGSDGSNQFDSNLFEEKSVNITEQEFNDILESYESFYDKELITKKHPDIEKQEKITKLIDKINSVTTVSSLKSEILNLINLIK